MYKSSPAFSITGKYNKRDLEVKPSPITYNVEQWNPKKAPSWKIGSDKKCPININSNPGPGQYGPPTPSVPFRLLKRNNKFGVIGKQNGRAAKQVPKSPSPDSYSPKLKENSASVSFAKKYEVVNRDIDNPGPGAYSRQITIKTQGSVIGKDERFRQSVEPKLVPGPGSYEIKRPSSAKVSFGKELRNCGRKLNMTCDPGPGQYQKPNLFEESTAHKKGYSIAGKITIKDLQTRPGPGNYDPDYKSVAESNPCFSMPRKYRPIRPDHSPGPNEYAPKYSHKSMHVSFSKSKRAPFTNNKDSPGPGNYQPQASFKASPKYSLGKGRKKDLAEDFPGPGSYQADRNVIKKRPQSAKIGRSRRQDCQRHCSPGPGEYGSTKKDRPSTPSFAFGKDSRMKARITTSPGPGEYESISSVSYTAPYALK